MKERRVLTDIYLDNGYQILPNPLDELAFDEWLDALHEDMTEKQIEEYFYQTRMEQQR